jgi:ribosomal protein L7Ae-like RNA K-turn-binding protein
MDNILSFLGLMKKARALAIGAESAALMTELGTVRLLVLPKDAAKNSASAIRRASEEWEVPLLELDAEKSQLGEALGQKECAALGITDTGFALALCQKVQNTELAEQLTLRLEREKKRMAKKTAAVAARKRRK